jgi:hypothetical protein
LDGECVFAECKEGENMTEQATRVNAGHFRTIVGAFEVTVLLDGYADLPVEVFGDGDAEGTRRVLAEAFLPADRFRAPLTAYLVDKPRHKPCDP